MKWYTLLATKVPTDGQIQRRLGELFAAHVDEGQALHFHQEARAHFLSRSVLKGRRSEADASWSHIQTRYTR